MPTAECWGFSKATCATDALGTSTSILEILPDSARLRWNECAQEERAEAIRAYEEVESTIARFPGAETVLVAVDSVDALRRAYPNYFADTRMSRLNSRRPSADAVIDARGTHRL